MISKIANCSKFREIDFEKTAGVLQGLANLTNKAARTAARDAGVGWKGLMTHDATELSALAANNNVVRGYEGMLQNMLRSNPSMTTEQAIAALGKQGYHAPGTILPEVGNTATQAAGQAGQQAASTVGGQIAQNAMPLAAGASVLGGTAYVGNRVFGNRPYGYPPRYY